MPFANDIFEDFARLNVLIVGDVMIDRYWHGKVSRISPEAPVPVVELQRCEDRLGGAANVALNLKSLGATPYLFSAIGKDTEGGAFLKLMHENGLPIRGILQSNERKTTVKTRILAGAQQMLRIDKETTEDISDALREEFLEKLRELLEVKDIHVIIFQDYNKGVLTKKTIRDVVLEAIKRDIPTTVDPKKQHFFEYKHVTLFKPNLKEIRDAVPFDVQATVESLQKAADYLRQQIGQQITMITLSEKGIFIESNTEGGQIYPTQARNISDVSGAGDTVVSVASLALANKVALEQIALLSNLAGGQVCEMPGVVPVNKQKLRKEYLLSVGEKLN